MSEKAPDYLPAPGILPEGTYGPDNFVDFYVTNSQTGGYEAADARGFEKISKDDIPTAIQGHFAKYPDDSVFLRSPAGYKVFSQDRFAQIQGEANAQRENARTLAYAKAEQELAGKNERINQAFAEDVGKVALDAAEVYPALNTPSAVEQNQLREYKPVFEMTEVNQLSGLLQETARQSAVYRQEGDRYIAPNDRAIAERTYQHIDRIKNNQESAEFGLVAISSALGSISSEAERTAVFDMLKRSNTLTEDDLRYVGGELVKLGQLEAVPGVEADHRKFAYAENLSRQANDELTANEGAANNKYLALLSIVHGVGSRINDRSYSNRVMDGAFGKIADSKR